ncbi:unnamed protein product [Brachionus calyciflorus]|uniref:Uncharacterized protein n=1 Tax=Brachionus calyciflorus TaxID=104777 RepID=A0A814CZW5_9BILA|nr:unnamed protein product [Brachionus calyciflorus]
MVRVYDINNNEYEVTPEIRDLIVFFQMQKNKFIGLNEDFEPIFQEKTVTTEVTFAKDPKNESEEEKNNTEEIYYLINPLDNHENTNISESKSYTEEMINFTFDLSTINENESNQSEETTDDELIPQNKFGINYSCFF